MLRLQLEQCFGKLPKWALKLIDEADVKTLEGWGLKLIEAERLEDILPKPMGDGRTLSTLKKRDAGRKRNGAK